LIAVLSLVAWRTLGTLYKCRALEAAYALGGLDAAHQAQLAACRPQAQQPSFTVPWAEDGSGRAQQLLAGSEAGEPAPAPVPGQVDRSGPMGDAAIQAALRDAWANSNPGTPNAHEMGGWIVQNEGLARSLKGPYSIEYWPVGSNKKQRPAE
jgi:hypothetical protein